MFLPYFYLPQKLYKDEITVWDSLAEINQTGQRLDPNIYCVFKNVVDKILEHRNTPDWHPLDFPIVRYFLCPDRCWNLPLSMSSEFIEQFAQEFDGKLVNDFFREINAKKPDNFYIDLESLFGVWECAKCLKTKGAKICEFHPQNETGGDVHFQYNNSEWIAEVKNLNHEDISLHCIAQVLAGLVSLEKEGSELRKWDNIMLAGREINDEFRTDVIKFLHSRIGGTLSKVGINKRLPVKENIDGFKISIYPHPKSIIIKRDSIQNLNQYLKLHLAKIQKTPPLYYYIGPSSAYFWPELLSKVFYAKLDKHLTKVGNQKKNCPHYLGFLNLVLHNRYSDSRKNHNEEQAWEKEIRNKLSQKDFPVVLCTSVLSQNNGNRIPRELIIVNEAAKLAGFTEETK